jgi:hypothetical protein
MFAVVAALGLNHAQVITANMEEATHSDAGLG